jgi:hypothetical protein
MSIESIEKEIEQYAGWLGKPMTDKQEYIERMRAKEEVYADQKPHGPSLLETTVSQLQQGPKPLEAGLGSWYPVPAADPLTQQHTASIQDLYKRIRAVEAETRCETSLEHDAQDERRHQEIMAEIRAARSAENERANYLDDRLNDHDKRILSLDKRMEALESDHLKTDANPHGPSLSYVSLDKRIEELEESHRNQPEAKQPEGQKPLTLEECVDWIFNHTSTSSWPVDWRYTYLGYTAGRMQTTRKALGK